MTIQIKYTTHIYLSLIVPSLTDLYFPYIYEMKPDQRCEEFPKMQDLMSKQLFYEPLDLEASFTQSWGTSSVPDAINVSQD